MKLVQPAFCGDCAVDGEPEGAGLKVAGIEVAGLGIAPGAAAAGDIPGATGCVVVVVGGWPGTAGDMVVVGGAGAPGWAGLVTGAWVAAGGGGGGGGFCAKAVNAIVAETREAMSNVFIS